MACGAPRDAAVPRRLRHSPGYRSDFGPWDRLLGRGRAAVSGGNRRPQLGDPVGDDAGVRAGSAEHDHDPASVPACRRQFAASARRPDIRRHTGSHARPRHAGGCGATAPDSHARRTPRIERAYVGLVRRRRADLYDLQLAGQRADRPQARRLGAGREPDLRVVEACAAALVSRPPAAAGNHGFVDRGRRRPHPAGHLARTPAAPGDGAHAGPSRPPAPDRLASAGQQHWDDARHRCRVCDAAARRGGAREPGKRLLLRSLERVPGPAARVHCLCDFATRGGSGPGIAPQPP